MEKIVIRISPGKSRAIDLVEFPHLASPRPFMQKGIDMLHRHLPRIVHFLSRQRAFSNFRILPLEILAPAKIEENEIRRLLRTWMRKKRNRRLFFILAEIAVLPLALLAGMLPGPNVFFYSIFILLYFHLKAFLSLGKIHIETFPLKITRE